MNRDELLVEKVIRARERLEKEMDRRIVGQREVIEQARDAVYWLSGPPLRLTLTRLVETALRREIELLKKDGASHEYKWLMQTPDDLKVIQPAKRTGGGIDLVIGDDQDRRLLVRILEAGSSPAILSARSYI